MIRAILPYVNIYNFYIIFPIFIGVYLTALRLSAVRQRTKIITNNYVEKPTKTGMKGFVKRKDDNLKQEGNPFGLSGFSYYIVKVLISLVVLSSCYLTYGTFAASIFGMIGGYLILDIFIFLYKRIRNEALISDLINIIDALYLQVSAGVSLGIALKGLHEHAEKSRELREELIKLAARYELGRMNIDYAVADFARRFNIVEAKMFTLALRQYNVSGRITEMLENLRRLMEQRYIEKLDFGTKSKKVIMILGVLLIMINTAAIIFYPVFYEISQRIFKVFQ
jgi:Flp pilus assembly protein TadB